MAYGSITNMPTFGSEQAATEGCDGMGFTDKSFKPDRITATSHQGVGYEMLASAIIERACCDYLNGTSGQRLAIERFIRTKYFNTISLIDPEDLIKKLRDKYNAEKKNGKKRPGRPRKQP